MQERKDFRGIATIIASRKYSHSKGGGIKFKLRLEDESQRELDYGICLDNPNPTVVATGQQRFANLAMACRLTMVTDTEQLHNISVGVTYLSNGQVVGIIALAKPREMFPLADPWGKPNRKPVSLWSRFKDWFNGVC